MNERDVSRRVDLGLWATAAFYAAVASLVLYLCWSGGVFDLFIEVARPWPQGGAKTPAEWLTAQHI